jgi:hypothetical protein
MEGKRKQRNSENMEERKREENKPVEERKK